MKRIKHNYWTDGDKFYSGDPFKGFKEVEAEPVAMDTEDSTVVEAEAPKPLKAPKRKVEQDPQE